MGLYPVDDPPYPAPAHRWLHHGCRSPDSTSSRIERGSSR
jgi:hypothetical protein